MTMHIDLPVVRLTMHLSCSFYSAGTDILECCFRPLILILPVWHLFIHVKIYLCIKLLYVTCIFNLIPQIPPLQTANGIVYRSRLLDYSDVDRIESEKMHAEAQSADLDTFPIPVLEKTFAYWWVLDLSPLWMFSFRWHNTNEMSLI